MNYLLTTALLGAICALQLVDAAPAETYSDKYDNINLEEVLHNDRLFKSYYECLVGTGKCVPEGSYLKEVLPDALQTKCAKCTEKQKAGAEKVIKYLIEKKPKEWAAVEKIYDPQGTYKKAYQAEAAKRGIKV